MKPTTTVQETKLPLPETDPNGSILRLKIDNTDIFLEEMGENRGKITISDTYGHNYSMFWGAMGGTLKEFICRINPEYFVDKLLGVRSSQCFDAKNTFAALRNHIKNEMGLPWYKHQEFQKSMREVIKDFQEACEEANSEEYFVNVFTSQFVSRLNYHLIKDSWESESVEKNFKELSEPWHFIQTKASPQCIFLTELHSKIIKKLSKKTIN